MLPSPTIRTPRPTAFRGDGYSSNFPRRRSRRTMLRSCRPTALRGEGVWAIRLIFQGGEAGVPCSAAALPKTVALVQRPSADRGQIAIHGCTCSENPSFEERAKRATRNWKQQGAAERLLSIIDYIIILKYVGAPLAFFLFLVARSSKRVTPL